jgi:UDP-glucose 4-epimerase
LTDSRKSSAPPLFGVDYRTGQFGDAFSMAEALQGVEIVYPLISTTVPGTSNLNLVADINDNLVATVVLLDQMIKMGVKRIVYLSSGGTVYGNPQIVPSPEDHPLNPICSYGVVKVAIENYLKMYQELYGLRPTIIRPSNAFGTRQGHEGVQGVIATFLAKMLRGEKLTAWGDGTIVRDYLYVTDLAKLCFLAGEADCAGVYNAGYGKGVSVLAAIDMIFDVTGIRPVIDYQSNRPFDVQEVFLDISRSTVTFCWHPTISLEQGIRLQFEWLSSQFPATKTMRKV